MSNVSDKEAEQLLSVHVNLRDKCKNSKSKNLHIQYSKHIDLCLNKFDYIVKNKAKRYQLFSNYDDLLQDGRMALIAALKSYDINKGSWFWWANQYVKTKISREANRHSTIKIPLKKASKTVPYKVFGMPDVFDIAESADNIIEKKEYTQLVHCAISKLPNIQRSVIEMYFEMGYKNNTSIYKICEMLNISKKEFNNILFEAKNSLRFYLENI